MAKENDKKWPRKQNDPKGEPGGETGSSAASCYSCPNPGGPLTLQEVADKILNDPEFAAFIHEQLVLGNQGDQGAINCVASYYKAPTTEELDALGITESKDREKLLSGKCTEHHRLVDLIAYLYGEDGES